MASMSVGQPQVISKRADGGLPTSSWIGGIRPCKGFKLDEQSAPAPADLGIRIEVETREGEA